MPCGGVCAGSLAQEEEITEEEKPETKREGSQQVRDTGCIFRVIFVDVQWQTEAQQTQQTGQEARQQGGGTSCQENMNCLCAVILS